MEMLRLLTTPRNGWLPWSNDLISKAIHHLIATHSSNDYIPQLKVLVSLCHDRPSILASCAPKMTIEQCHAFLNTPPSTPSTSSSFVPSISSTMPPSFSSSTSSLSLSSDDNHGNSDAPAAAGTTNDTISYCPIRISTLAAILYRTEISEENSESYKHKHMKKKKSARGVSLHHGDHQGDRAYEVNQFKDVFRILIDAAITAENHRINMAKLKASTNKDSKDEKSHGHGHQGNGNGPDGKEEEKPTAATAITAPVAAAAGGGVPVNGRGVGRTAKVRNQQRAADIVAHRNEQARAAAAAAGIAIDPTVADSERSLPFNLSLPVIASTTLNDYFNGSYTFYANGLTLLAMAVERLSDDYATAIISLLIEYDVDMNVQCRAFDDFISDGDDNNLNHPPLWYACRRSTSHVAHLLLNATPTVKLSTPPVEILVATVHNHIDIIIRIMQSLSSPSSSSSSSSSRKGGKGVAAFLCRAIEDESKLEDDALTQRSESTSDSDSDNDNEESSDDDNEDEKEQKSPEVAGRPIGFYPGQLEEWEAEEEAKKYGAIASKRPWIVPTDILLACILYGHIDMATFWLSGARIIPIKYTSLPSSSSTNSNTSLDTSESKRSTSTSSSLSSSSITSSREWLSKIDEISFDAKLYFPDSIIKRAIWRPLHKWQPLSDGVRATKQQEQKRGQEYRTKFAAIRALAAYGWTIPDQSDIDENIDRVCSCIAAIVSMSTLHTSTLLWCLKLFFVVSMFV
jgi:hypothetical protein